MTQQWPGRIGFGRKLTQTSIIMAAVAGALLLALVITSQIRAQSTPAAAAPLPSFDVASIKLNSSGANGTRIMGRPGSLTVTGIIIKQFIAIAFNVKDFQISGGPGWISSERYDIEAKADDAQIDALRKLPPDQMRKQMGLMNQSLLADRFKLKVSHDTKELPIYSLVVAKNGPKFQESNPGGTLPSGIKFPDGLAHPGMMMAGRGQLTGQALPMTSLVMVLSQQLGRTVLDQTGLKGKYDIALKWTPDEVQAPMPKGPPGGGPGPESGPPPDPSGPSIFTAIQEQLGLKLESSKGPVEIIVIDHIERPSEN